MLQVQSWFLIFCTFFNFVIFRLLSLTEVQPGLQSKSFVSEVSWIIFI